MTAATEIISIDDPVVSANWLHSNLGNSHVKVLDGSWYMPHEKRNAFREYQVAHIPGALFFDLDGVVDVNSDLPHMLPSEGAFAAAVSALGISNEDTVVVYDGKGFFSAPRIWWMFRVFGHDKVWVLDGGFPRWRALGFDIQATPSEEALARASAATEATKDVYFGKPVSLVNFQAKLRPSMVWNLEQVQQNIHDKKFQHVDARSKGRFYGVDPEPRKGIKSGHIPGSKCIPFPERSGLITKMVVRRWMQQVDTRCSFCQEVDEDLDHLFWNYPFFMAIWQIVVDQIATSLTMFRWGSSFWIAFAT